MMCEFAKYMAPIYEFWIQIMQSELEPSPYIVLYFSLASQNSLGCFVLMEYIYLQLILYYFIFYTQNCR